MPPASPDRPARRAPSARLAFLLLAVAALGIGLLACGQDGPEVGGSAAASIDTKSATERIEALTARFEKAIRQRDAKAFCELLAPNDVQRLGKGKGDGKKRCLAVWGKGRNPLFEAKDVELEIERIEFEGSYASAELSNGGKFAYANEDGRWYVHLVPERQGGKG